MPTMRAQDLFPDGQLIAPRGPHEPLIAYGPRALYELPARAIQGGVNDTAQALREGANLYFGDPNPAQPAKKKQSASEAANIFPKSYTDPAWNVLETKVATEVGNPTIARALAALRLQGERSNSDQVSTAGAKTPYQITPQTRQGIIKQHGFDPWASPENAVKGAMIAATTYTGLNADYTNPQVLAKAAGGYFAGAAGARNPFGAASDGSNTTGQYTQRVLGPNTGLSAPFINPFDPAYANQALGQIDKAAALSKQPFEISGDVGPMPEMPKPDLIPKTDFSKTDADLQAMRPQEVSLKEQHDIKWKNFWAGLGKAMSSMPEGAGIGDFFLKLGGGILMGKAAGAEEIQNKQEEFSNKLAKWQAALYENDAVKAQTQHQELLVDFKNNQDYVNSKYQTAMNMWLKNATPTLVGDKVIFSQTTPEGRVSVKGIPIASMVDAEAAREKVSVLSGMFSQQNDGNSQVARLENGIQGQLALGRAAAMLTSPQSSEEDKAAAAAYGAAQTATFAVDSGQVANIIGEDSAKALEKEVLTTLTAQGIYPGSADYADAAKKMMSYKLGTAATMDTTGQTLNKLMNLKPAADIFMNYAAGQKAKESTRVTTDSRGRTTRSTTTTGNPFADAVTGQEGYYPDIGPYKRY
jgi:hypothetical protein